MRHCKKAVTSAKQQNYKTVYKQLHEAEQRSLLRVLGTSRFWFWFIISIILIGGSIILEQSNDLEQGREHVFWFLSDPYFLTGLFRELGFAGLIALLIWMFVEHNARKIQIDETRKFRNIVASDVFDSTIGLQISEKYKSIRDLFLDSIYLPVMRPCWDCTCELIKLPDQLFRFRTRYLILKISAEFELENVSHLIISNYQLKIQVPKPHESDLIEFFDSIDASIHGTKKEPDDKSRDNNHLTYYWYIELLPNQPKRIVLEYSILKRITDSQLITGVTPSSTSKIRVINSYDDTLTWSIEPVGSHTVSEECLERHGKDNLYVEAPLLACQGYLLTWRADPSISLVVSDSDVQNHLLAITSLMIDKEKTDRRLEILGLDLNLIWPSIKSSILKGNLSNWEIIVFHLSKEFIEDNPSIFPKDWHNNVIANIENIKRDKETFSKNNINFILCAYSSLPAIHGFRVGEKDVLCAQAHWKNTDEYTIEDSFRFYEYFPACDTTKRSEQYRELFANWIDRAKHTGKVHNCVSASTKNVS